MADGKPGSECTFPHKRPRKPDSDPGLSLARYRADLLRDNGSSAMHDAVIAPAICAWLASGDPQAEGMQRYRAVLSYARCG